MTEKDGERDGEKDEEKDEAKNVRMIHNGSSMILLRGKKEEEAKPVVIHLASSVIRAGLADDERPRVFRAVVGYLKDVPGILTGVRVGDAAISNRGKLRMTYNCIDRGIVRDIDALAHLWHHTFYNELRVNPEEHPVLFTEVPLNPLVKRERILGRLFKDFNVPLAAVHVQDTLALLSHGRTTGCVVHSGSTHTRVVPIYEGSVVPHAIRELKIGGDDVSSCMRNLLAEERSLSFFTQSEQLQINRMKEAFCFVALDFEEAMKPQTAESPALEKCFELLDGQILTIEHERFRWGAPIQTRSCNSDDCAFCNPL